MKNGGQSPPFFKIDRCAVKHPQLNKIVKPAFANTSAG